MSSATISESVFDRAETILGRFTEDQVYAIGYGAPTVMRSDNPFAWERYANDLVSMYRMSLAEAKLVCRSLSE